MIDLRAATKKILEGSILKAHNGINLYTPDGVASYAALWMRDLAYMLEYSGDLVPLDDTRACLEYLMAAVREDGWIPDRVAADGFVRYTAGGDDFPALPNLDDGPFLAIAVDVYLSSIDEAEAKETFLQWKETICRGIDCLPVADNGLIENTTTPPHSPYGFTDCIVKTGLLCKESILLWRGLVALIKWLEKCGIDASKYADWKKQIETNLEPTFADESGMLLAATEIGHQIDVWGSCYAISVGYPLSEDLKLSISKWMVDHYDEVVQDGQVRHTAGGEFWQQTLIPVEPGTYQNGAYWATPAGWAFDALMVTNEALAVKQITDVLNYFEQYGIFECVNGEYRKLDTYVVSATNVYGVLEKYEAAKARLEA